MKATSGAVGQTTCPAPDTGRKGESEGSLAIQWVFPGTAITQVSRVPGTIGRDPSCDTVLTGSSTSRRHAEIKLDGPVPVLRDLGSRNGVSVNGAKVSKSMLKRGDIIRTGDWLGVLVELDALADPEFRSITDGWYGGARLAQAVQPAQKVAPTDLPVTIQGETGVGKEGVAHAIHDWSGRQGKFIAVNCAALPPELAEAELFGYRKGAFTGADRASLGYFRAANGGTLLLDEILDLPTALQAKLLRVLEEHEVNPIGETETMRVDVRVLAATQEPLAQAVTDGRFRLDLMARLDGLTVVVPPLRDRREDIAPLFVRILSEKNGGTAPAIEPGLIEQLLLYDWPLNVRELVLLARRLLVFQGTDRTLTRSMLPERILEARRGKSGGATRSKQTRNATDDDRAFDALVEALRTHGGNVNRAAAALGISRSRAYRLLNVRPLFDHKSLRPGASPGTANE